MSMLTLGMKGYFLAIRAVKQLIRLLKHLFENMPETVVGSLKF